MEVANSSITHDSYLLNQLAQKSVSTIRLCESGQNLALRGAKSFTGAIEELKFNTVKENTHGEIMNCRGELYTDETLLGNKMNEIGYETREVLSNQIFLVRDDMLTYQGRRYSLSDIATKWKKDCRMWLWKSNKPKIKSLQEIRDKLQNVKIQ